MVTSNSAGVNMTLAGCINNWHKKVLHFANGLLTHKDDVEPSVIVELFLPLELIFVVDLTVLRVLRSSQVLVGRGAARTKDLVSELNFVVRSLDRAETHFIDELSMVNVKLSQRLRKARGEGGHVLLVTSPPPTYGPGDYEDDCPWQKAFDNRTDGYETAVCIYLAEHPSDPERMEHLLDDFINAHLPLTLLWHRNVSQDHIPADNRLSFAKEVLAMPRDQSLSLNSDQNGAFTQIHTSLPNLNIGTVALNRRKISISDDHMDAEAAKKAIILMDVHDHWPRLITRPVRDHPQDRLSSP
jgi:hypothetical protein